MFMAVFRINKSKAYTVMSNYHLRDVELSCKACGLLSKMLSLPDEWDYTTRGLAAICKDGVDAIGSALKELEQRGYLIRHRLRDDKGKITDVEYVIYEKPQLPAPDMEKPDPENPHTENPDMDNPCLDAPCLENSAQLNTKKSNKEKSITDLSSTDSFLPSEPAPAQTTEADRLTDGNALREKIKKQIEYDVMVLRTSKAQLDELVELMVEVQMNQSPMTRIGRDAEYSTGFVQHRFRQINSSHIEKVLDGIAENTTRVRNTKAYLLAALFNAVSTIDNHYTMLDNYDQHCY